ncbi:RcnB family protein [Xanthomonas albilineans]|uniref:RcnB family protein n=1 Tax=Xanthomonas albilineans TaxID=29447 RepID=UPI0005F34EC1|nr:RcnB family protein [Xanthomonas albilineans]
MNVKRFATLALCSALALGCMAPTAFAWEPYGPYRDWDGRGWREVDRDDYWREREHERHRARRAYERGYRDGYRERADVVYYRPPPPPPPYWARGQRYDGPNDVVYDYDRYRVSRPPYGYRWVRDDRGDLLLVAIATGVIADLVLNGR